MSKSFYSWLLQFKTDDTPIGDLTRDARLDKDFPRYSVSRKYLRNYLESMDACDRVMNIFEEAFTHYEEGTKQKS